MNRIRISACWATRPGLSRLGGLRHGSSLGNIRHCRYKMNRSRDPLKTAVDGQSISPVKAATGRSGRGRPPGCGCKLIIEHRDEF